jgi:cytochrome bd-type quinol oxidase subunit 2
MVMGCYLTTAFAVAGMSAWMILRQRQEPAEKVRGARRSLSMALWFAAVFVPVQIVIGDLHGLGVLAYQPTKLAAMEGNWERMSNMPLRLFAIPDEVNETNHYEIAIPKIGSWILTHAYDGVVPGLKDVPRDQRPPVWPVFFSFRIMVGIGFLMLGLALWSLYLRWKGTLFTNIWFLRAAMLMTPSGFGAVLFGWFTAEIGRQPYVVYGYLRTADAVSPVTAGAVTTSLVTFFVGLHDRVRLRELLSREAPAQRARAPRGGPAGRRFRQPRQAAQAPALDTGREPRRIARAPPAARGIGGDAMTELSHSLTALLHAFAPGLEGPALWLPLIWAGLLAIAVAMYVVVDGFDLGVGIMFTSARSENWRDRMMLSVAPIWDGNETWLILGGGGLFAVFGMAYWVLLPALYIPLLVMLIALDLPRCRLRVPLQGRYRPSASGTTPSITDPSSPPSRRAWCSGPSCRASRCRTGQFAGGTFDWFSPFSLMTGVGLVCGYGCSAPPGA